MLPAVVLMVVIFLYPTLRTIAMSLFKVKSVTTPLVDWKFVGFGNFFKLFKTPLFVRSMVNILKIWIYNGIATMVLSMLFALAFTKDIRFKKFFRTNWKNYVKCDKKGFGRGAVQIGFNSYR